MSNSYKGNSWFQVNKSPTAVIFVHGILSSCNSCWLNKSAGAYWPEIVSKDERMVSPSIFLGEYPSKIKSGEFDAYDAAELLYGYLKDEIDGVVPLDKEKLLFVCHSQGGGKWRSNRHRGWQEGSAHAVNARRPRYPQRYIQW